jgi:DNA-binding response OmpR family regulator
MKTHVHLEGLLFTNDEQVLCVMRQILNSFAIETEVCSQLDSALAVVTNRRLDAMILDWDGVSDPTQIARVARKSSPNSNSTIVAMVNGRSETHALLVGANFMIHKPTDVEHAKRCMRAAYGTILQNRRRAARVPLDIPVLARVGEFGELKARITDLSIGGLALHGTEPLPTNREVLTHFELPGTNTMIHALGRIVNADSLGRAGVRFSFMPDEDRSLLEGWLAVELAKLESAEMPTDDAN